MQESSSSTDPIPAGHVLVGTIGKAHGLAGHVFVLAESDHPERFAPGSRLLGLGGEVHDREMRDREMIVVSSRTADARLIVAFEGVNDRTAAERLRNTRLTIPEHERRSLGPEEWWPDDLIGLRVQDHAGNDCGVVTDVIEGVAQDRLSVVIASGATVEIPFVATLVPEVDVGNGFVRLADVEGLLTEL